MALGTGSKRKVLVIEDEQLLVELLCRAMSDLLVEVATDGKEARQKLDESDYDLLIADLHIPGIRSRDLLRMMLEKEIGVPTIIISGLPLSDEYANMLRGSQYSVMLKPFQMKKIRERVMDLLRSAGSAAC